MYNCRCEPGPSITHWRWYNPMSWLPQKPLDQCLMDAVKRSDIKAVSEALFAGADVNFVTPSGDSPLSLATKNNDTDIVKLLLRYKADVNLSWNSPLTESVINRNEELAFLLLKAGAQVNRLDMWGQNALYWAIPHLGLSTWLIQHGADPNIEGRKGTPLYRAAKSGSREAIKLLLAAGAEPDLMSRYTGKTPLMVAEQKGDVENVALLRQAVQEKQRGEQAYWKFKMNLLAEPTKER